MMQKHHTHFTCRHMLVICKHMHINVDTYRHICTSHVHIIRTSGPKLDTSQMTSGFIGGTCRCHTLYRWHNTSNIMETLWYTDVGDDEQMQMTDESENHTQKPKNTPNLIKLPNELLSTYLRMAHIHTVHNTSV